MASCECGGEVEVVESNATVYRAECQKCGFLYGEEATNTAEI